MRVRTGRCRERTGGPSDRQTGRQADRQGSVVGVKRVIGRLRGIFMRACVCALTWQKRDSWHKPDPDQERKIDQYRITKCLDADCLSACVTSHTGPQEHLPLPATYKHGSL